MMKIFAESLNVLEKQSTTAVISKAGGISPRKSWRDLGVEGWW